MSGIPITSSIVGEQCPFCGITGDPQLSQLHWTMVDVKNVDFPGCYFSWTGIIWQIDGYPCRYDNRYDMLMFDVRYWIATAYTPPGESRLWIYPTGQTWLFHGTIASQCLNNQTIYNLATESSPSPGGYYGGYTIIRP